MIADSNTSGPTKTVDIKEIRLSHTEKEAPHLAVEGKTGVRPKGLASESVTKHRRWQTGHAGEGAAHQNCDLGQLVSYK